LLKLTWNHLVCHSFLGDITVLTYNIFKMRFMLKYENECLRTDFHCSLSEQLFSLYGHMFLKIGCRQLESFTIPTSQWPHGIAVISNLD
jgi:hypothetical protein